MVLACYYHDHGNYKMETEMKMVLKCKYYKSNAAKWFIVT